MNIFDEAKKLVSPALISEYFPQGKWNGKEYFIPSPFRSERTPSLAINEQGLWVDYGDANRGGSFIDLVAQVRSMEPRQAAQSIIERASGASSAPIRQKNKKKLPPAPGGTLTGLKESAMQQYRRKRWGQVKAVYQFFDKAGALIMGTVRYVNFEGKKNIIPFCHTETGWVTGRPPGKMPLYHSGKPDGGERLLVVEGEKCADAAAQLDGWRPVSWHGGCSAANQSDWSTVYGREAVIWPDNDEEGMKAARRIASKLRSHGARVLLVEPDDSQSRGYDIADMIEDRGVEAALNVLKKTLLAGEKDESLEADESLPFIPLGFDERHYWVLPGRQKIPLSLSRSDTGIAGDLGNVAPISWWQSRFQSNGRFAKTQAIEYLRSICLKKGVFDHSAVLGVGPHMDNGRIILNTGRELIPWGGEPLSYEDYRGELTFCRGAFHLEIPKKTWTLQEISRFWEELGTFGFATELECLAVAGWCVIAPWSSLFARSPHLWITGSSGTGKTMLLDSVIAPALGRAIIRAEGRTSEAGLRQAIGQDCRPVLLDEFEADSAKSATMVEGILTLARSAYGGSEIIKGSAGHGAVRFKTRMSFCFASVQPILKNAANASRIVSVELSKPKGSFKGSLDMAGIRGLAFSRLHDLVEAEKGIRDHMKICHVPGRAADTWAPIFAGAFLLISPKPYSKADRKIRDRLQDYYADLEPHLYEAGKTDEDTALEALLHWPLRVSPSLELSAAEALEIVAKNTNQWGLTSDPYGNHDVEGIDRILRRRGLRLFMEDEQLLLAISTSNPELKQYMREQGYEVYQKVLMRHPQFTVNKGSDRTKFRNVRMAGKTDRCVVLRWKEGE